MKIAWIAAGGALGASLRWLLASAVQARAGTDFPFGTLAVNVLGCAALGACAAWLAAPGDPSREALQLFLVVGVLGGFTTMSAFAWETASLLDAGLSARALLYLLASNTLCVLSAWGAFTVARAARG
jgi:fluoride exporter